MDLHQLKVFRAAATSGGFTRAGQELHLSQSTVSLHIKRLEEDLGCSLFIRTQKRVYLTDAGRLLVQYTDRILQELKNAGMAVREHGDMQRGTIRLGSGATTVTYLLPRILGRFQHKYPHIEMIVTTGSTESLSLAVHQQTLDMALVMLPVSQSLAIELLPVRKEELVLVVSAKHPLASRQHVSPEEMSKLPFISFLRGSAMQAQLNRHFDAMGIAPRITMELENIEAIKSLVRAGLGSAILPLCSVASSQTFIRPLRVKNFAMNRDLALALPRANVLPLANRRLANRLVSGLSGHTVQEIRDVVSQKNNPGRFNRC